MPKIRTFGISSLIPASCIEEDLVTLFHSLPKLRKVVFPRFYFTTRIAEALSVCEDLEVVEFQYNEEQGRGDVNDVANFAPTLQAGAFPVLWDHSMTVSFANAVGFFDTAYSPANITTLYIDSPEIDSPDDLKYLLSALADNCQLLKNLTLISSRDPMAETSDVELTESFAITLDTIKPAFRLPVLTLMELLHQYPVSLSLGDLETLAKQWPSIETLILSNEPVHLIASPLTFDALLPFARHCPRLTHLGLFIDATNENHSLNPYLPTYSPSQIPTLPSLQILSMGVSIAKDDHKAALALSQVLVAGCKVECGITWDERFEVSAEISETVQKRCAVWVDVAGMLPVLVKLRMEERERTRLLEKELEVLRGRTGAIRDLATINDGGDGLVCVVL